MWKKYRKRTITEIRPWEPKDGRNGQAGDMIARDPAKPNDEWLLTADFFKDNYDPVVE